MYEKMLFCLSLGGCQGSSSTTGQEFFEGAACSLASINLMVYLPEEMQRLTRCCAITQEIVVYVCVLNVS